MGGASTFAETLNPNTLRANPVLVMSFHRKDWVFVKHREQSLLIHGRLTQAQPKRISMNIVTAAKLFASFRRFMAFVRVVADHFHQLGVDSFAGKLREVLVRSLPHSPVWMQAGRASFTEKTKIFSLGTRNTEITTC